MWEIDHPTIGKHCTERYKGGFSASASSLFFMIYGNLVKISNHKPSIMPIETHSCKAFLYAFSVFHYRISIHKYHKYLVVLVRGFNINHPIMKVIDRNYRIIHITEGYPPLYLSAQR